MHAIHVTVGPNTYRSDSHVLPLPQYNVRIFRDACAGCVKGKFDERMDQHSAFAAVPRYEAAGSNAALSHSSHRGSAAAV